MVIKVLVLDSDGVVNSYPTERFSDRFKKEYPDQTHVMDFFESGVYNRCRRGESCVKTEFPKFLEGTEWSIDSILKYWHEGDNGIDEKVIDLVKSLKDKNISVYLATNQANCRTEYMINKMGLNNKIFNRIVASCDKDIMVEKPDERFFERLFRIICEIEGKIKPEEILFFDDQEANIISANNFGIKSYQYFGFEEFKDIIIKYNLIKNHE